MDRYEYTLLTLQLILLLPNPNQLPQFNTNRCFLPTGLHDAHHEWSRSYRCYSQIGFRSVDLRSLRERSRWRSENVFGFGGQLCDPEALSYGAVRCTYEVYQWEWVQIRSLHDLRGEPLYTHITPFLASHNNPPSIPYPYHTIPGFKSDLSMTFVVSSLRSPLL